MLVGLVSPRVYSRMSAAKTPRYVLVTQVIKCFCFSSDLSSFDTQGGVLMGIARNDYQSVVETTKSCSLFFVGSFLAVELLAKSDHAPNAYRHWCLGWDFIMSKFITHVSTPHTVFEFRSVVVCSSDKAANFEPSVDIKLSPGVHSTY